MAKGDDWTRREVELAVADYMDMLLLELAGIAYNKSETRRELLSKLEPGRTEGSVERKRMNISAALLDGGLPCINGYKPYSNYQALLPEVVDEMIAVDPRIKAALDREATSPVVLPTVEDILEALEKPPERKANRKDKSSESVYRAPPLGINYLEIDAQNAVLGAAGEEFCIRFEKARLTYEGAANLADRIEHIAETVGPSAGYDIRSYEKNGQDRFIEVKTTKYGKRTPFFISPNEVRVSVEKENQYQLYRLYQFKKNPRLFLLPGSVASTCELTPSQLKATVR